MTDPQTYLGPAEEKMELAVAFLDESLAHIRAGKANPKSSTVSVWITMAALPPSAMWQT